MFCNLVWAISITWRGKGIALNCCGIPLVALYSPINPACEDRCSQRLLSTNAPLGAIHPDLGCVWTQCNNADCSTLCCRCASLIDLTIPNQLSSSSSRRPKIGIIGNGFVGESQAFAFSPISDVYVYDKNPLKSLNSLSEVLKSDFIFVCVPTLFPIIMSSIRVTKLTGAYSNDSICSTNQSFRIRSRE